ncbi:hypothetical protein EON78_07645 [bacterium]|nr:MAG: hypothetical protein EON78_07645 [bacterium]
MTTLTGHLSLYATQSLKSIDNWMNVVQGNVGGSLVTGFKEVEITYGGNITHELRATTGIKNGVQIAEQSLTTANTRLNWKQGEVISSTQDTHFAIQGDGFFLLAQPPGWNNPSLTNKTAAGTDLLLTRAGDFHWGVVPNVPGIPAGQNTSANPILLNKDGLIVLAEIAGAPDGSDNYCTPVSYNDFYGADKIRPSVHQPSYDTPSSNPATTIVDYDELVYSRYGSTVLTAPTATSIKTIVNGSYGFLDSRGAGDVNGSETRLIEKALEASNVKVERNITELAVMGKVYNGFVQLIKVYNSNLDEVLGFIR